MNVTFNPSDILSGGILYVIHIGLSSGLVQNWELDKTTAI